MSTAYQNPQPTSNLLIAALDYARRGWPVFPIHCPRVNGGGPCSCGKHDCASVGKHARIRQWPEKATTDPEQIRAWWRKWADANIGIVTGQRSRLLVLDVDVDKGGSASLAELERKYGALPETWIVETGGGGWHHYFLLPEGVQISSQAGVLAQGLDTRSERGCVVAPPSLHESGKRYTLQESAVDLVPCPDWLLRELRPVDLKEIGEHLFGVNGHAEASSAPILTEEECRSLSASLLDQCRRWIKNYCVVTDEQADVLAVWLLHTWTYQVARCTPYMQITSPLPECGKSTLMDTLAALARKPISSGGMTAAVLVRIPEAKHPTLFLDEMDATFKGDRERAADILGILNNGYKASGVYYKCVGKNHDLHGFPVYCPKAFAGIGGLPDTVTSRSIVIEMRRKLDHETVEMFDEEAVEEAARPIRDHLERWSESAKALLKAIKPERPASLRNRRWDNAKPLLAIASLAGPDWTHRLIKSLEALFQLSTADDPSVPEQLLLDLKVIFGKREKESSENLVHKLWEIEGRPWVEWRQDKPMSANQLARELKRFKISPKLVWVDGLTKRGYDRIDFEEVWARFSPTPLIQTVRPLGPASTQDETAFSNRWVVT